MCLLNEDFICVNAFSKYYLPRFLAKRKMFMTKYSVQITLAWIAAEWQNVFVLLHESSRSCQEC